MFLAPYLISLVSVGSIAYFHGLEKQLCPIRECCHEDNGYNYIRYKDGPQALLNALETKVHGQPLVTAPIYKSVTKHLTDKQPPRPLVMYFSGWTGTGKTFVANLIASSLFQNGLESRYVKYISSGYHFPTKIRDFEIARYREVLRDMIRETVSRCERSLIILDELDKLPAGVVDGLQPMLDYVNLDGISFKKAIFIFLSNTGGEALNALTYKMYREGKERKDLSSKDIEEIMIETSLKEQNGLSQSSILKRYSIGVFVPFLPLERKHVIQCIHDEMKSIMGKKQLARAIDDQLVEEIADEISYFPNATQLYSKSGCKGVHDKVVNNMPDLLSTSPIEPESRTGL